MISLHTFLVLLSCSWSINCHLTTCIEEIICIANGNGKESECPQIDAMNIVSNLSGITVNCTAVHIYITSGTHVLNGNLNFTDSVEKTRVDGTLHGQNSTIMCLDKTAIKFSESREDNKVFLSNLIFTHCELRFKYASYSLDHVAVMNTDGYGVYTVQSQTQEIYIAIVECTFNSNVRAVYIDTSYNATVSIRNSTFSDNTNEGLHVSIAKHLEVIDCQITNNAGNGIFIDMNAGDADIGNAVLVNVSNCLVENNAGTGVTVERDSGEDLKHFLTDISNVTFLNNSRALYLVFKTWDERNDHRVTKVRGCSFGNHILLPPKFKPVVLIKTQIYSIKNNEVIIENCSFKGNRGDSALYMDKIVNATLDNVNIYDNECTGLTLSASRIKIKNHLNITRNSGWQGGAISLIGAIDVTEIKYSQLLLSRSSIISMINNTAVTHGGGIFTNETCKTRNREHMCFFQIETVATTAHHPVLHFSGNRANLGGDSVFGGCLSNCSIQIDRKWITIDKNAPNNTFWSMVSSDNPQSQSTFVEYPKGAMFCANTSIPVNASIPAIICNGSHNVHAFRGQTFTLSVIAGDEYCYPTNRVLRVEPRGKNLSLLEGQVIETQNYCHQFSYALAGALGQNKTTMEFTFQDPLAENNEPAILTIHLRDCPPGLNLDHTTEQCKCAEAFQSHQIECHSDTYTLKIPAQTWVSKRDDKIIVQKECQYCKNEVSEQFINNITNKLCLANRSGILCGRCIEGYSLKLGGYDCARCSKSPLVGVTLVIAFTSMGFVLVLLLLRLDLTISTGAINGLIFYSNIVYLNSDIFLPTGKEGSNVHLQNTIKVLSTFQAWMNLDFGIVTCFFDGYNTYISIWMQFVFPLYIWLLILIIVLASWYSTTVAKITTSNTVPVLATLLLLSYAKLLKTSIETFSSVKLTSLDGVAIENVWKMDGNIPYLGQLHIPLFVMSLLMVIAYVIPFTLLILLGPLLRAKSHYWFLRWIHKIKPFLDAFYGCYTIRYRHWPGLMLLARVAIIGVFASYSTNDNPFKLMTISMMVLILFVIWLIVGRTHMVSFYRKQEFNYLELFFLSNLGAIAIVSIYTTQFTEKKLRNQQVLAVVMVGSALIVFFGIIVYRISQIVLKFTVMQNINNSIQAKLKPSLVRTKQKDQNTVQLHDSAAAAKVTHTEVDLRSNKLREPLLTD